MNTFPLRVLAWLLCACLSTALARAAGDSTVVYTDDRPLIYEDASDLWPYSFLNINGEPDGYNIDLIRLLMSDLGIPYKIKLKQAEEVFVDLKEGRADLTLGLANGYHDEYGQYSKNAITLFTQSVATPRSKPVVIRNLHDLGSHKVIVREGSLSHHLMIDYGWEDNAIPVEDIREALQQLSTNEEGQIVWNHISLKYLINRYHLDNLELTPVNMPHGQYKFMARDTRLLDLFDDAYSRLYANEKVTPIQNKWFYPERQKEKVPDWVWAVAIAVLALTLIFALYSINYRIQARRREEENIRKNKRLALIMQTSHVRIWTYDIANNQFAWRNDNGQVAYTYTMNEFSQRYSHDDFIKLRDALDRLSQLGSDEKDEHITLNLRAKDVEGGDMEDRDYVIVLSVLSRNKEGRPTVIIGTKKDVTDERRQKRRFDEQAIRYRALVNTSVVGIMLFDRDGFLTNINGNACDIYQCKEEDIIAAHVHLYDLFDIGQTPLPQTEGMVFVQIMDGSMSSSGHVVGSIGRKDRYFVECRLMTVVDDDGELICLFAVCRDITATKKAYLQEEEGRMRLRQKEKELEEYKDNINRVLTNSNLRLAAYSPNSHTFTIMKTTEEVEHALTQTRCMTLVDETSKRTAMRLLNDMDGRSRKTMDVTIRTTLRTRAPRRQTAQGEAGTRQCYNMLTEGTQESIRLELKIVLRPVFDKNGQVQEYVGYVMDVSLLSHIESKMAVETAKVMEVEATKNSFVKNMVQEIRTPMNTVAEHVAQLQEDKPGPDEQEQVKVIVENSQYLLHLIDNILYLSRLQAHMVEFNNQPRDYATLFETQCAAGWERFQNANTRYVVENPYEQLVVDIDAENLGQAIVQLTANAAEHTHNGFVKTRCDYIGRRLMIVIDDTGEGIQPDMLERINRLDSGFIPETRGLGLAICKELISQMGGNVEVYSEVGSGTTVYLSIPCHASVIRRKKVVRSEDAQ